MGEISFHGRKEKTIVYSTLSYILNLKELIILNMSNFAHFCAKDKSTFVKCFKTGSGCPILTIVHCSLYLNDRKLQSNPYQMHFKISQ